jgi:hypothetical protein
MKVAELLVESKDEIKVKREKREASQFRKDYQRWRRLVNIPMATIRMMLPTERGRKTSLSAKDTRIVKSYRMTNSTVRAIFRLRTVPLANWKTADINWMYRQLSFIDKFRKKAKEFPLMQDGKPTDVLRNLWAWGHIPKGKRPTQAMMLKEGDIAVHTITPSNVDDVYTVGKVLFDNEEGLGSTPDNANVAYKGFVLFMKPSEFLKLALPADREEDASAIAKKIEDGHGVGNPCLYVKTNDPGDLPFDVRVMSHEGRARASAFKKLNGDVEMPVQIFPAHLRARNFNEEWFKDLRKNGITPETNKEKSAPLKINITKIFWNGKEL